MCSPTVSGASVDPTSQVRSSTMFVVLTLEISKVQFLVRPQWYNVHKFFLSKSVQWFSTLIMHTDGQTDMASPLCVHFMCIVQRTHNDCNNYNFSPSLRSSCTAIVMLSVICTEQCDPSLYRGAAHCRQRNGNTFLLSVWDLQGDGGYSAPTSTVFLRGHHQQACDTTE
jgi:hypothetical protein